MTADEWVEYRRRVELRDERRRYVESQLEWSDAPGRQWVNVTLDAKDAP